MKRTFFLETTADCFAMRLEDCTLSAPYRGFPGEKGRIVLQPARISFRHPTLGYIRIDMEALYIAPLDKGNKESAEPLGSAISFKVVPLASERIEVTAECYQPVVLDYFKELLTEIGTRWPEAKQWLEAREKPVSKIAQPLPSGFPKKGSTFDRYKQAYSIIIKYRRKYKEEYNEFRRDRPAPQIDDFRDALAADEKEGGMGWKPSGRTVQTIIRLGDEGFLQDEYREMVKYPNR